MSKWMIIIKIATEQRRQDLSKLAFRKKITFIKFN